ncbi:MAG: transglutaminase N-terminal domain-containing protein, partial [Verrucomicrobiota bacterium]
MRPAPHCRTRILSYSLTLTPEEGNFVNWQQDAFSNHLARVVYPEKVREFAVTVDLVAEIAVYNPFDFFLEPYAEKIPFAYDRDLATELAPYRRKPRLTPRLQAFVESIDLTPRRALDFLVSLNQRLWQDIRYT